MEEQCYLINAVPYPINRDRKGHYISDSKRIGYIQKEKGCFLSLVNELKAKGHIHSDTKVILIKKTVYEGLFEAVDAQYPIAHSDYIAFPRYYNDLNFTQKIRAAMGRQMAL